MDRHNLSRGVFYGAMASFFLAYVMGFGGLYSVFGNYFARTYTEKNVALAPQNTVVLGANTNKKLLLFQGYSGVDSTYASTHKAEIDALPFDGIVFAPSVELSKTTFSSVSHTVAEYKSSMAGMAPSGFAKTKHNFAVIYAENPGNVSTWANVSSNLANLAQAANETGIEGIFFDTELYELTNGVPSTAWLPEDACPSQSTAQCRAAMQVAGQNAMAAMRAKWPAVKIMTTYGPYLGDNKTFGYVNGSFSPCPYKDFTNAEQNMNIAYFTVGLLEGTVGNSATYIDGGENYSLHDNTAAKKFYDWRKTIEPQQSAIIPNTLRNAWPAKLNVAQGIQDDIWCQYDGGADKNQTATGWKKDLVATINNTDEYVWAFARLHRWYANSDGRFPHVTQDFIDATIQARAETGIGVGDPVVQPPTPPTPDPGVTPQPPVNPGTPPTVTPTPNPSTPPVVTPPNTPATPATLAKSASRLPQTGASTYFFGSTFTVVVGVVAMLIRHRFLRLHR
jgi:hypothetical protein